MTPKKFACLLLLLLTLTVLACDPGPTTPTPTPTGPTAAQQTAIAGARATINAVAPTLTAGKIIHDGPSGCKPACGDEAAKTAVANADATQTAIAQGQ